MTPDQVARLDQHRAAAAAVTGAVPDDGFGWNDDRGLDALREVLTATTDPTAAAMALLALPHRTWWWAADVPRTAWRLITLADATDVALALTLALETHPGWCDETAKRIGWVLPAVQRAVEALGPPAREAAADAVVLLDHEGSPSCAALVRRRSQLVALAGVEPSPGAVVTGDDAWAERARAHLTTLAPAALERALLLLAQFEGVPGGPTPSAAWRRRIADALDADGAALVRALLTETSGTAVRTGEIERGGQRWPIEQLWSQPTQQQLKGALWAAAGTGEAWVPGALVDLAVEAARKSSGGPAAPKVANAAIAALATLPPDTAAPALAQVETRIRHRSLRTQVAKARQTLAAAAGITPDELAERSVPTHGLDADGRRAVALGDHTATLAVEDGEAVLRFTDGTCRVLRGAPKAVKEGHAPALQELRGALKDLRATLTAERARLEALLPVDRGWRAADWRTHYLGHPVTGALAARLVWTVVDHGTPRTLLPQLDGVEQVGDDALVALWHPCEATPDEVRAWRERLLDAELAQPVKQVFREVYLLTPAEEETGVYSNRFAAHVVRAGQFQALVRTRGWAMDALGYWDGGFDATPARDLPAVGLRAQLFVEVVEDGGMNPVTGLAELAVTDQVRFTRLDDSRAEPVPLTDVPRRALSEVLRDVDLFVSVASVAMDPTWLDRGEDRFHTYWTATAFGELGPSAQTRREVLTRLLPRLRIADRCQLEERYLVVRGDRRTYRIHLGSANIKMEPNDQYLCIVAARDPALPARIHLPFDDDRVLSLILSKAFLLADDLAITDPTILAQIGGAGAWPQPGVADAADDAGAATR